MGILFSKINFQIESVNGLSYKYLFKKAIDIIIEKLQTLILKLDNREIPIEKVPNIDNSFNFKIDDFLLELKNLTILLLEYLKKS